MAGAIRSFSRLTLDMFSNNVNRQILLTGSRTLYTAESLGMTSYKSSRCDYQERYRSSLEAFKEKMKKNVEEENSLIFTEDLKALLHVVERSPEEIDILKTALHRFNNQDNDMRFGSFRFGPVVMRTFHYLNEPNIALETFRDPKFEDFYNQYMSFTILADLLYENGMYKEVREVYDLIRNKFASGIKNPKFVINILAVACYKENTKESLDFGVKVCQEIISRGSVPFRKVITTLGALALKQNAPHIALELMTVCKNLEHISSRSIRTMALCDLNRLDDVTHNFQIALKRGIPANNKFFPETTEKVEAAIQRGNVSPNAEICELFELIKSRGYIENKTLEEHISEPLHSELNQPGRLQQQNSGWTQSRKKVDQWPSRAGQSAEDRDSGNRRFNN